MTPTLAGGESVTCGLEHTEVRLITSFILLANSPYKLTQILPSRRDALIMSKKSISNKKKWKNLLQNVLGKCNKF